MPGEILKSGTFDFLEQFKSVPAEVPSVVKMIQVGNARPVHELRQAFAKREFRKDPDSSWPTAALPKSGGRAQLKPVEVDDQPLLPPKREIALAKSMLAECKKLSDLDADVLDAVSALYLERAQSPTDDVKASINELLEMRGLEPRLSGQRRRGGFSFRQRAAISNSLTHLEDVWLTFPDFRVRAISRDVLQTRCFVVSDRKGQLLTDGSLDIREFIFRPGLIYGEFLFGQWRQTAWLAKKALHYHPVKEVWEKRVARYLSWQWRVRASGRSYFQPIGVKTLLDIVGPSAIPDRPGRIRARLESCLDRLKDDSVIAQWQYHGWPQLFDEARNWKERWASANILVEPPDLIRDAYRRIGKSGVRRIENGLGSQIRQMRLTRKLSLMRASEELGMHPSTLDSLESGETRPLLADLKILNRWLAA